MNGTVSPWKTDMLGLYARASEFDGVAPWNLTPRWKTGQAAVDLSTPFDFVADTDIIGGNSGSPMVNRDGELVGLVFDGNIDSLAGKFEFDARTNRTIAVHSAAMIEALRKLYDAGKLADELQDK
jgi:S1-C subfamily serine protease